ncbi:MAG: DUF402 domain-containing protein [Anaerolineales bacterium]|nr:DUF402 domain-containing protein [Anaerolineales bacterium]
MDTIAFYGKPPNYFDIAIYNYVMTIITVIKCDHRGNEIWRYEGTEMLRRENCILIEAFFDRDDMDFHGMPMQRGDRFVETYFTDRWYNIFEIHDHHDDRLRGWYLNIACPAVIDGDTLSYNDLALDVLFFPDGRQLVLDEDEFETLDISSTAREKALAALHEIQQKPMGFGITYRK